MDFQLTNNCEKIHRQQFCDLLRISEGLQQFKLSASGKYAKNQAAVLRESLNKTSQ
jgi:hypothetical protein